MVLYAILNTTQKGLAPLYAILGVLLLGIIGFGYWVTGLFGMVVMGVGSIAFAMKASAMWKRAMWSNMVVDDDGLIIVRKPEALQIAWTEIKSAQWTPGPKDTWQLVLYRADSARPLTITSSVFVRPEYAVEVLLAALRENCSDRLEAPVT